MHQWIQLLIEQIRQTTLLEWLAVLLGVAEVLLAKRNNILLYPAGIGGSALSIFLLLESGLYAEAGLSVYYVVMSIYGWIIWVRRKNEPPLPVTYASKNEWLIVLLITFGGWLGIYLLLHHFTKSTVPVWDALVSSTAWAGTWLLARRKIENWVVLNISNLFAVPLLFYKHLPLFALLTVFLFVVAVFGFFDWQRIYRKEKQVN
ncbi:nicotinamide riboside transporter PnuC [Mucilaginibacter sp. KACC 22063]|uniref:nicotinamide riboside transporter PnuC n=1 Tax=Mucilaginibacter sp. KACC 22063 TaxID=3025666 RepID=UPI002366652F|nr:nicotinamide riboside transporter PnuC [Mucilaginibacter sp. KACC 22063]WDF55702.1 nicotinamide riboside transporter PnuC [Mucilaginibacter sp. KACC 22063]